MLVAYALSKTKRDCRQLLCLCLSKVCRRRTSRCSNFALFQPYALANIFRILPFSNVNLFFSITKLSIFDEIDWGCSDASDLESLLKNQGQWRIPVRCRIAGENGLTLSTSCVERRGMRNNFNTFLINISALKYFLQKHCSALLLYHMVKPSLVRSNEYEWNYSGVFFSPQWEPLEFWSHSLTSNLIDGFMSIKSIMKLAEIKYISDHIS